MTSAIEAKINIILTKLKKDERLNQYVDWTLPILKPYCGLGEIKLIVLGQDPTIKDSENRKNIKTVLNLDKNRSVHAYLAGICNGLGIKITENVYATNLCKNFFIRPPTKINEIDIFKEFMKCWLPLLKHELELFESVPMLTMGEPVLTHIISRNVSNKLKDYWGYTSDWQTGKAKSFQYIFATENLLERVIFPFSHIPTMRKQFYKAKIKDYISFVRSIAFS